jgi:hypothetical protein
VEQNSRGRRPHRQPEPSPETAAAWAAQAQAEADLDAAFAKTFNSRHGQIVLTYLRGKYIFGILPPEAIDQALRHREGQRSIVAEIEQRKERAK